MGAEAEQLKKEQEAKAKAEAERLKKEQEAKAEAERLAKEKEAKAKAEAERLKKEQEAKAEAERVAKEKARLEKARLEEAEKARLAEEARVKEAAKRAEEEEIAIANMTDPIQELFLTSIKAYSTAGGLENADQATQAEVKAELARVAKQFGGADGEDMAQFPELEFKDPEVESINIS